MHKINWEYAKKQADKINDALLKVEARNVKSDRYKLLNEREIMKLNEREIMKLNEREIMKLITLEYINNSGKDLFYCTDYELTDGWLMIYDIHSKDYNNGEYEYKKLHEDRAIRVKHIKMFTARVVND